MAASIAVDTSKLPRHIAIIMDGNGRWARKRKLPRFKGHLEGVKRVEEIVRVSREVGLEMLTLFTFSTENWSRPKQEVDILMDTLCSVLHSKAQKLLKNNIKLQLIGKHQGIPPKVLRSLNATMDSTKHNNGLIVNLAFNYGSRAEIVHAVKRITAAVQKQRIAIQDIDEDLLSNALYTRNMPDPDLLIRTSGEQRISNFLLWQLSYAELYFTKTLWPDFDEKEFFKAIGEYQNRERRYGAL